MLLIDVVKIVAFETTHAAPSAARTH